ncbi:MAG: RNA polymerase sigma factor [Pseudomonadota bacterium]
MIKAQAGDQQAYGQLLNELYPVVSNYLKKRLGALGAEEDFAQECLLAVHNARQTYDPERAFSPWMFTVVKYKSIDLLRKKQRVWKNEVADEDLVTNAAEDTNSSSEEDKELVRQALSELPDDMRRAVELTKIEGLTTDDAAKKENISAQALRARVSRAYKLMRKQLESSGVV